MFDSLPSMDESKGVLLTKGMVGIATPVVAVLTSFQEQVEWYLRIAGLVSALLVSVLTIASLLRRKK